MKLFWGEGGGRECDVGVTAGRNSWADYNCRLKRGASVFHITMYICLLIIASTCCRRDAWEWGMLALELGDALHHHIPLIAAPEKQHSLTKSSRQMTARHLNQILLIAPWFATGEDLINERAARLLSQLLMRRSAPICCYSASMRLGNRTNEAQLLAVSPDSLYTRKKCIFWVTYQFRVVHLHFKGASMRITCKQR